MFDMLTTDELFALHTSLYNQGTLVHARMLGPDGQPRMDVFGDDWRVLAAWHAEVGEMQQEIGAELRRRAQEARADA